MDCSVNLHFGLTDRHCPALLEGFYPPNLPEDWRSAYLMNEFNAMQVAAVDQDAQQVCADLDDAPQRQWLWVDQAHQYLDWPLSQHHIVFDQGDLAVWRPGSPLTGAVVGLVPATSDPARLREFIEAFIAQIPKATTEQIDAALFVQADARAPQTAHDLKMLAGMMGVL